MLDLPASAIPLAVCVRFANARFTELPDWARNHVPKPSFVSGVDMTAQKHARDRNVRPRRTFAFDEVIIGGGCHEVEYSWRSHVCVDPVCCDGIGAVEQFAGHRSQRAELRRGNSRPARQQEWASRAKRNGWFDGDDQTGQYHDPGTGLRPHQGTPWQQERGAGEAATAPLAFGGYQPALPVCI